MKSIILDINSITQRIFEVFFNILQNVIKDSFQTTNSLLIIDQTSKIWIRRVISEICRLFLEIKCNYSAISCIIQVLIIYQLDAELFSVLAR